QEPFVRIGGEQAGNRAARHNARLAQFDVWQLRRRHETRLDAKTIAKKAEKPIPLDIIEPGILYAPAVEFQAPDHDEHLPWDITRSSPSLDPNRAWDTVDSSPPEPRGRYGRSQHCGPNCDRPGLHTRGHGVSSSG